MGPTTTDAPSPDIYATVLNTAHGPVHVTVVVRDPSDRHCFPGGPVRYHVRSAATPAEFTVDGSPYGGTLDVLPDGTPLASNLYRAGCFGRLPRDGVAADITFAVMSAMGPHDNAVGAALREYRDAQIGDAVAHWGGEVERLRLELAAAEQHLADAMRLEFRTDT